jgi:hypothetical protein
MPDTRSATPAPRKVRLASNLAPLSSVDRNWRFDGARLADRAVSRGGRFRESFRESFRERKRADLRERFSDSSCQII